jgi:hypothetical protein
VATVVLKQRSRELLGSGSSASRAASQLVKRRSELVDTDTDAGDLVAVVIR